MRYRGLTKTAIAVLLLAIPVLSACTSSVGAVTDFEGLPLEAEQADVAMAETVASNASAQTWETASLDNAGGGMSASEIAGLQYMREEEKLAHDLYAAFYEIWGIPIFSRIAASETTHTETVLHLLDRFGIEDPAHANAPGVFLDPSLQSLYDTLLAQAARSLDDALRAGALIEEVDIQDLVDRMAQTDESEIQRAYASLMVGSENHLSAFAQQVESRTGQPYVAQVLEASQLQQFLVSSPGRGGNGRFSN
jgi:hypothetical protein